MLVYFKHIARYLKSRCDIFTTIFLSIRKKRNTYLKVLWYDTLSCYRRVVAFRSRCNFIKRKQVNRISIHDTLLFLHLADFAN